jgi:LCP family protein required for cell wall assembly
MACSFPVTFQLKEQQTGFGSFPVVELATRNPYATSTPTPFQPGESEGQSPEEPQETPTRMLKTPTATPTLPVFIEGGVDRIPQSPDQVNILILGSDFRPGAGFRTDVILLVGVNPKTGKGSMVSFPRYLYLNLPGRDMQRINTAMAFGGFELLQQTFEYNFGVHPDYYVMTDFSGFVNIVDTLGGIDIQAEKTLSDWCDLPSGRKGYCTIDAGKNHLNGEMALWYSRSRYSTSDFDRGRRAQEIIRGFFNKLISLDALKQAPVLISQFQNSVEMNIPISKIVEMMPLSLSLTQTGNFRQFTIGPDEVNVWIPPSGAYLLLPNEDAIRGILTKAFE